MQTTSRQFKYKAPVFALHPFPSLAGWGRSSSPGMARVAGEIKEHGSSAEGAEIGGSHEL